MLFFHIFFHFAPLASTPDSNNWQWHNEMFWNNSIDCNQIFSESCTYLPPANSLTIVITHYFLIFQRITWRKYTCPNQIGNQAGEVIAVGPVVSNSALYGVNSFGRNEEYVSELLLKQPLTPNTDGVYVCEGSFITDSYPQDSSYTTIRDVIIIGGKGMYQNCFAQFAKTK